MDDNTTKKRRRAETPEASKALRSDADDTPRSRTAEDDDDSWTLRVPRPLVTLMRDLCERLPVEHFITARSVALGRAIDLNADWTVETSHDAIGVLPRWMHSPELLTPEADGEMMVTMHTHPKAAISQSLGAPSLRRRQQQAKAHPLLYVPSLADVNNILRFGMHVHIVVTPFHWFVCHAPAARAPTQLTWDMQTLLAESETHEQTVADWVRLVNEKCDGLTVVALRADAITFDYESCVSAVTWVHYDAEHMTIELDFGAAKRGAMAGDADGVGAAAALEAAAPEAMPQADAELSGSELAPPASTPPVATPREPAAAEPPPSTKRVREGDGEEEREAQAMKRLRDEQEPPAAKVLRPDGRGLPGWWARSMGVLS